MFPTIEDNQIFSAQPAGDFDLSDTDLDAYLASEFGGSSAPADEDLDATDWDALLESYSPPADAGAAAPAFANLFSAPGFEDEAFDSLQPMSMPQAQDIPPAPPGGEPVVAAAPAAGGAARPAGKKPKRGKRAAVAAGPAGEAKEPAAGKKPKRGVRIAADVVFYVLVASFLTACVWFAVNPDPHKSLFGYRFYNVLSGSMKPAYQIGDLIIVHVVPPSQIKKGDVVTKAVASAGASGEAGTYVTHRVIAVGTVNGTLMIQTKGDANPSPDQPVPAENVIGVVSGHIPHMGGVVQALQHFPAYLISHWYIFALAAVLLIVIVVALRALLRRRKKRRLARTGVPAPAPSGPEPPPSFIPAEQPYVETLAQHGAEDLPAGQSAPPPAPAQVQVWDMPQPELAAPGEYSANEARLAYDGDDIIAVLSDIPDLPEAEDEDYWQSEEWALPEPAAYAHQTPPPPAGGYPEPVDRAS